METISLATHSISDLSSTVLYIYMNTLPWSFASVHAFGTGWIAQPANKFKK